MFPVIRPRHSQVPTQQNVRMVARLFVFEAKWIRICWGYNTAVKEFSAFIQVEARQDHSLRQPWVVPPIPEGICQTHRVRQAKRGTIEIQSACFSIIPGENSGVLLLCRRQ